MNNTKVIIISAFKSEVSPIIERLKLKRITTISEFIIYRDSKSSFFVALSGKGELAVANMLGYLVGKGVVDQESVLFNVGIAGSKELEKGGLYLINKVTKKDYKQNLYPLNIVTNKFKSASLETVEKFGAYPEVGLVDMEGYSFLDFAGKFVKLEQIILLKIVSDNQVEDLDLVGDDLAEQLMRPHLDDILAFIFSCRDYFSKYYNDIRDPEQYAQLLAQVKFSFSQRAELKKLLIKIDNQNKPINLEQLLELKSAHKILDDLRGNV